MTIFSVGAFTISKIAKEMSFQEDDLGGDDLLQDEQVEDDEVEGAAEQEKEEAQSLPLASGADDSRNDISDVGLAILAIGPAPLKTA